jgi:2-oxoglutarate ferredoxin oxidoreductase subunit beta
MNVGFVARSLSSDIAGTKELMKRAIAHKGLALVDIFQPCVSFNKLNTLQWFKENTYPLGADYDARSRAAAFAKALEETPFPLGVLYESDERESFEEGISVYREDKKPLRERVRDPRALAAAIAEKR